MSADLEIKSLDKPFKPVVMIQSCENQADLDRAVERVKKEGVTEIVEFSYKDIVHPNDTEEVRNNPKVKEVIEGLRKNEKLSIYDDETLIIIITENRKLDMLTQKSYLIPKRAILYRNYVDKATLLSFHMQISRDQFDSEYVGKVKEAIDVPIVEVVEH